MSRFGPTAALIVLLTVTSKVSKTYKAFDKGHYLAFAFLVSWGGSRFALVREYVPPVGVIGEAVEVKCGKGWFSFIEGKGTRETQDKANPEPLFVRQELAEALDELAELHRAGVLLSCFWGGGCGSLFGAGIDDLLEVSYALTVNGDEGMGCLYPHRIVE